MFKCTQKDKRKLNLKSIISDSEAHFKLTYKHPLQL